MKLFVLVLSVICIDEKNVHLAIAVKPPKWDAKHSHIEGVLYISDSEIEEPFEAWFDHNSKRSRIDYFGGTTKTYQLSRAGKYGALIKIVPVTTGEELNVFTCFQMNGTKQHRVEPQPILPDCTSFKFTEKDELLGWKCSKFEFHERIDGSSYKKHTMWVRYDKATRKPIPVRYEMRGYNTLLGTQYDQYHLDYNFYSNDVIPDDIFEIEIESCEGLDGFPDPTIDDDATFNPMKEFIHPTDTLHIDYFHHQFIKKHSVSYATHKEHLYRKYIFMQNWRFIQSKNRERNEFTLAINHLADRTKDELIKRRGLKRSSKYNGGMSFPYQLDEQSLSDLPDDYDWRLYGAVTPVKDQSDICGSCWAFSTTAAVEGAWFLHNGGKLIHLSQQALIDCSWGYYNYGCDGGDSSQAYEWIHFNGGIPTDTSYGSYRAQDGFCHVEDKNVTLVAPITGWVNVTSGNSNAMKIALLRHGPVNVAIDASPRTFSFYSHGVYYEKKCGNKVDELNHTVLVVGYGDMNGKSYWLVRNSWSSLWGINGYILMSTRKNNCGVLTDATYVIF